MMWKDSYRLGVERIDEQHKELFRMTEDLVNAVQRGASVTEYQKALEFLKDYVIYHFRDEEAYQASIQYEGLAAHQAEHRQFTQTVQQYEKRLTENGFEEKTMKDLAGTVTAWLIYHVVEAVFGFSRELALHLLQTMTGMELTEIDELVQSALCELTNISCGNTATALTERGLQCDIKPPVVAQELVWDGTGSGVHVDTAFGGLEIGLLV